MVVNGKGKNLRKATEESGAGRTDEKRTRKDKEKMSYTSSELGPDICFIQRAYIKVKRILESSKAAVRRKIRKKGSVSYDGMDKRSGGTRTNTGSIDGCNLLRSFWFRHFFLYFCISVLLYNFCIFFLSLPVLFDIYRVQKQRDIVMIYVCGLEVR